MGFTLGDGSLLDRQSDCAVRVLESNLQNFRRYQPQGLLRKLHDTVGVHQDLDGPRGCAPAFQHLEEAEVLSVPRVIPHCRSQSVQPAQNSCCGFNYLPQRICGCPNP